jgi:hypothetical protein
VEDEKLKEFLEFLEKEIEREKESYKRDTDVAFYHLGYADALRSVKYLLQPKPKVQF